MLIGKDRKVVEQEIGLMKHIGKTLGFEKGFCERAIQEVLENKYIVDRPPEFSTQELAMKFIKDGLSVAFCDDELHPFEEEWLRSTAEKNGVDAEWFVREREYHARRTETPAHLEVDDLAPEFS